MALQEPVALTRIDPTITFDWSGISPAPPLPTANYSVRWTGRLRATTTDTYTITFVSDDGARVYFNGATTPPSIDDWNDHAPIADAFSVPSLLDSSTRSRSSTTKMAAAPPHSCCGVSAQAARLSPFQPHSSIHSNQER